MPHTTIEDLKKKIEHHKIIARRFQIKAVNLSNKHKARQAECISQENQILVQKLCDELSRALSRPNTEDFDDAG